MSRRQDLMNLHVEKVHATVYGRPDRLSSKTTPIRTGYKECPTCKMVRSFNLSIPFKYFELCHHLLLYGLIQVMHKENLPFYRRSHDPLKLFPLRLRPLRLRNFIQSIDFFSDLFKWYKLIHIFFFFKPLGNGVISCLSASLGQPRHYSQSHQWRSRCTYNVQYCLFFACRTAKGSRDRWIFVFTIRGRIRPIWNADENEKTRQCTSMQNMPKVMQFISNYYFLFNDNYLIRLSACGTCTNIFKFTILQNSLILPTSAT